MRTLLAAVLSGSIMLAGLTGCDEQAALTAVPEPREPTLESIGYYCNMIVRDHPGPKGQIFVEGKNAPVWFTSVRDTLAFTMLPEEPKNISVIYVNDMTRASWEKPEPGTWVDARQAWYVLDSGRTGGMGAPEPVPFATESAARTFAEAHGGQPVRFANVPADAVIGPVPDGTEHARLRQMEPTHRMHNAVESQQ